MYFAEKRQRIWVKGESRPKKFVENLHSIKASSSSSRFGRYDHRLDHSMQYDISPRNPMVDALIFIDLSNCLFQFVFMIGIGIGVVFQHDFC